MLAIAMAFLFALTNGFHDAANAIATLVATRVARPLPAVAFAAFFNLIGPFLLGAAVASTVAGIVKVSPSDEVAVTGAALTGATAWNSFTWLRALPSSSSHALVGGLIGAAVLEAGIDAVNWGGFDGWRPVGVFGVLIALAISPVVGFAVAAATLRIARRALKRASVRMQGVARQGQWFTSGWLAFSHGANDAQKAVGIVAAMLLATGHLSSLQAPIWVTLGSAVAVTLGTVMGGWTIVRTIGRRIIRLRPLDGLVSQGSSATVIIVASIVGAPVSTTQVVSSSIVGVGVGRRRTRHVHWHIVGSIGLAWFTTMPAAAVLAMVSLPLWRWLT